MSIFISQMNNILSKSVLFISDDPVSIKTAQKFFVRKKDCKVYWLKHSDEITPALFVEKEFDMIVVDSSFQGGKGYEIFEKINIIDDRLPIVLIVNSYSDISFMHSCDIVPNTFLVSPITASAMADVFQKFVESNV